MPAPTPSVRRGVPAPSVLPLAPAWAVAAALALAVAGSGCRPSSPPDAAPPVAGCPAGWLEPPAVDASIAAPAGNARVVLHLAGAGSQNYACAAVASDAGKTSYAWSFRGPEAALSDCRGTPLGRHFASESGATAPEWQLADGAYVIAHKTAASSPGGGAVPWLLLSVDGHSGAGPLTEARYVQRVHTSGGVAPGTPCDATNVGAVQKVPYSADYFFFGP
jgi:hypothetical protein